MGCAARLVVLEHLCMMLPAFEIHAISHSGPVHVGYFYACLLHGPCLLLDKCDGPSHHHSAHAACHVQTVQYIQPQHHAQLSQAELVVIDEAAAIPLPLVKAMLGPYLVFLCSTVNGYEGTGRSLSLKLISQLRAEVNSHLKNIPADPRVALDLQQANDIFLQVPACCTVLVSCRTTHAASIWPISMCLHIAWLQAWSTAGTTAAGSE